ncbi:MAG TPA: hypothetical protein VI542_34930 [Candidatus Tectomicrobia bacterium]
MTLEDIFHALDTEAGRQTLTPQGIRRYVLLAYEMGLEDGKAERMPRPTTKEETPRSAPQEPHP